MSAALARPLVAPRAWTWTCLLCNAVGDDAQKRKAHRCLPVEAYRDFWIKRLQFTFPSRQDASAAISNPVDRMQLVEWFGWQWDAWTCSQCCAPAVLASTPFDRTKPNNGRPVDLLCQRCAKPKEAAQ